VRSAPALDPDDLAERVLSRFMQKLADEAERRGVKPWS
jgi:hypothetical protein